MPVTAVVSDPIDQNAGFGQTLQHFAENIAVRITVSTGNWLIFGKAVITNNDGSAQGASAKLQAHDSSLLLDQTDVKIEGNTTQCMSVQGRLTVKGSETIHISCSTFKGSAFDAQLMAVAVDTIVPVKE